MAFGRKTPCAGAPEAIAGAGDDHDLAVRHMSALMLKLRSSAARCSAIIAEDCASLGLLRAHDVLPHEGQRPNPSDAANRCPRTASLLHN